MAQSILGISYLYGNEVEVDYKEAFKFLSAAARQGASRAALNLGHMYAKGLGIPKNMPEAIRLFEAVGKPEESSDAFAARIELGRIYSSGLDCPVDVNRPSSGVRLRLLSPLDVVILRRSGKQRHTLRGRTKNDSRLLDYRKFPVGALIES